MKRLRLNYSFIPMQTCCKDGTGFNSKKKKMVKIIDKWIKLLNIYIRDEHFKQK